MAELSADERVELARRGFAAYEAGDMKTVVELFDPEIEVFVADQFLLTGTHRGIDGFVKWIGEWNDAWKRFESEIEEVVAVGDRHAVARVRQVGLGRGSGIEVDQTVGFVFEVRDGRCVHLALHPSFEEAVGVAEDREKLAAPADGD